MGDRGHLWAEEQQGGYLTRQPRPICAWFNAATVRASRSNRCFSVWIVGDMLGQHLDRDGAIQARVAGSVDLAHAPRAEGGIYLVGTERGAWR